VTYALRACSQALLAGSKPSFPSGSAGVAVGDRWLLMAVRGHLGDMRRPDCGPRVTTARLRLQGISNADAEGLVARMLASRDR
jgi:hypothetical protein